MTPIFYATADVHWPEEFGAGAWRSQADVAGDVQYALGRVVDLCVRDDVPLVLAGDVVDGPDVEPAALAEFFTTLRPLAVAGLPILYVLGNHERGRDWLAAFGPYAVRLDGKIVRVGSVTMTGLSFTDPAALSAALTGVAPADVGVYHQTWVEWGPGKGVSVSTLPPHRLVVCGDVHVRGIVSPPGGPRLALSPGPLVPQSTTEFGPSAVYAVGPDLVPVQVPIRGRQYVRIDVTDPSTADACLAYVGSLAPDMSLPDHLSKPMVAVRTTVDFPELVPALTKLAADRGVSLRVTAAGQTGRSSVTNVTSDAGAVRIAGGSVLVDALTTIIPDPTDLALTLTLIADGTDPAAALAAGRADFEAQYLADPNVDDPSEDPDPGE